MMNDWWISRIYRGKKSRKQIMRFGTPSVHTHVAYSPLPNLSNRKRWLRWSLFPAEPHSVDRIYTVLLPSLIIVSVGKLMEEIIFCFGQRITHRRSDDYHKLTKWFSLSVIDVDSIYYGSKQRPLAVSATTRGEWSNKDVQSGAMLEWSNVISISFLNANKYTKNPNSEHTLNFMWPTKPQRRRRAHISLAIE